MSARPVLIRSPAAWPFLALGAGLLAGAGVCLVEADAHMAALGQLCGEVAAHCAWCGVADLLVASAVASFALGIRAGGWQRVAA